MPPTDFDEDEFEVPDDEDTDLEPINSTPYVEDHELPEPEDAPSVLAGGGTTAAITDEKVFLKYPHVARGQIATQLLDAADHLGLDSRVIKAQTDGFVVPIEVARYLFPTEFGGEQ